MIKDISNKKELEDSIIWKENIIEEDDLPF